MAVLDDKANGTLRDAGDSKVEIPRPAQLDRERPHGFRVEDGSREGGPGDDGNRARARDSGSAQGTGCEHERDPGGSGGATCERPEEVDTDPPSAEIRCDDPAGKGLPCRDGFGEIHVETGELDGGHGLYFTNLVCPPGGERAVTFMKEI